MYSVSELYDLSHTLAGEFLGQFVYPWEALGGIEELIRSLGKALPADYRQIKLGVWVHQAATLAPTAYLGENIIVGPGTEIRHGAFVRGGALIGADCVVGNSTEVKNAILFDGVQVPHYNYVGDSILGYKAHLGAGAITSNVKSDKSPVVVGAVQTGRKKVGAMVGDYAEIGCNSVLNPGAVIGRHSAVYPLSCVRGLVPANSIYKTGGVIVPKEEA